MFGRAALRSTKKMVRALSVWAEALQFEPHVVLDWFVTVKNSARSPEVVVPTFFCSLRENRTHNVGRTETCGMKKYIADRSV